MAEGLVFHEVALLLYIYRELIAKLTPCYLLNIIQGANFDLRVVVPV